MKNNVADQRFWHVSQKKYTFHFLSANSPTFCEAATESVVQNGTDKNCSHSRCHSMYNHQKVFISELSTIFRSIKRFPADSAGSGSNLNYNWYISCPLFFWNFISRFTTSYFIIDTQKYLNDSITTHERSWPRLRLDFQTSIQNSKRIIPKFKKNNSKIQIFWIWCFHFSMS